MIRFLLVSVALLACSVGAAEELAPEASAPAPASDAPRQKPVAPAAAAKPPADLDFNLLDAPPPPPASHGVAPAPEVVEKAAARRRQLLTLHQGAGLATLTLLGATAVVGQLNYLDRFGGAQTARFERSHEVLAWTSVAAFAGTGGLAYFAPVPYARPAFSGFDTTTVHKVSMLGATACMVAEPVLGLMTYYRQGLLDGPALAKAHLVTGYAAFGFMAAGALALVF